jgi:hypothetical protein
MTRTKTLSIAAVIVAVGLAVMPAAEAFHGGWWRGFDRPTTNAAFPNPGSRAISATGQILDLDFQWGGGGGVAGTATIEMFDPVTGALVHSNTVVAAEDISSVTWNLCTFPNSAGLQLEEVPLYSLIAPGVLNLGPGAPGGTGKMRNSFCNDASVDDAGNPVFVDPLYYKAFSDYEGTYIVGGVSIPPTTVPPTPCGLFPLQPGSIDPNIAFDCRVLDELLALRAAAMGGPEAPLPAAFHLEVHVRGLDHA